jgi:hypothetical protein
MTTERQRSIAKRLKRKPAREKRKAELASLAIPSDGLLCPGCKMRPPQWKSELCPDCWWLRFVQQFDMRRKYMRCWWRRGQSRGGLLRWLRRFFRLPNRSR